jgi:hypothetical protein
MPMQSRIAGCLERFSELWDLWRHFGVHADCHWEDIADEGDDSAGEEEESIDGILDGLRSPELRTIRSFFAQRTCASGIR